MPDHNWDARFGSVWKEVTDGTSQKSAWFRYCTGEGCQKLYEHARAGHKIALFVEETTVKPEEFGGFEGEDGG